MKLIRLRVTEENREAITDERDEREIDFLTMSADDDATVVLGILSTYENRSGSRGNYYSYELGVPFMGAIQAMSDVLRLESEIETIREIASMNNVA